MVTTAMVIFIVATAGSQEMAELSADSTPLDQLAQSTGGIVVPPDRLPDALERFGQVDSTLARKYEGAGLGLPIAKHLAELHGGTLAIESALGVGTTVSIVIPAERFVERTAALAASA